MTFTAGKQPGQLDQNNSQQQSNGSTLNINMNIMNIGLTGMQPSHLPLHDVQAQTIHKRS